MRQGYLFAEVPYSLGSRGDGESKAVTFPSLMKVVGGYLRLVKDTYFTKGVRIEKEFDIGSSTKKRYAELQRCRSPQNDNALKLHALHAKEKLGKQ